MCIFDNLGWLQDCIAAGRKPAWKQTALQALDAQKSEPPAPKKARTESDLRAEDLKKVEFSAAEEVLAAPVSSRTRSRIHHVATGLPSTSGDEFWQAGKVAEKIVGERWSDKLGTPLYKVHSPQMRWTSKKNCCTGEMAGIWTRIQYVGALLQNSAAIGTDQLD